MFYKPTFNQSFQTHLSKFGIIATLFLYFGLSCLVISLFLPSLLTPVNDIYGFWVLITGWMGFIFFQFAWYANPISLLAILYTGEKPNFSIFLSILALLIASESYLLVEIPTGVNLERIVINRLGPGFYIWYLAQFLFLFATIFNALDANKKPE